MRWGEGDDSPACMPVPGPYRAPMRPRVVVVGSFVQDLTWKCVQFPRAGETVIGTFVTGPGGKGSNQAVACARAGVPTLFVGAVGRDVFADGARRFYRAEGIGARFVVKPRHATGTAAIFVDSEAQNEIIVALGASAQLRPRDVDPGLIRGAKVLVCQHEASLTVNAHAFRAARRAGATTVLNPAPMRADFDPAILELTDVLIPNESEFVALVNRLGGRSAGLEESALAALALPRSTWWYVSTAPYVRTDPWLALLLLERAIAGDLAVLVHGIRRSHLFGTWVAACIIEASLLFPLRVGSGLVALVFARLGAWPLVAFFVWRSTALAPLTARLWEVIRVETAILAMKVA